MLLDGEEQPSEVNKIRSLAGDLQSQLEVTSAQIKYGTIGNFLFLCSNCTF